MPVLSRRHLLESFVVLVAAGSGCTTGSPGSTPTATATERQFAQSVDTPPTRTVRNSKGDPAVRSSALTPTEGWADAEWVVTSRRERDALTVTPAAAGRDATRAFIADTDLSAKTLLVHQYRIEPCLTRQLEQLQWGPPPTGPKGMPIKVTYTTTDRNSDCQPDAPRHIEATLVRLPGRVDRIGYFSSLVS